MNTIRQGIIGDELVVKLMEGLEAIVLEIKETREDLLDAEQLVANAGYGVAAAQETTEEIECEAKFDAAMKTVAGTGKKLYTNEEQRGVAAAKLLAVNQSYIDAVNRLAAAKKAKGIEQMHVGKLLNQLKYQKELHRSDLAVAGMVEGLCHETENINIQKYIKEKSDKLQTIISDLKKGVDNV